MFHKQSDFYIRSIVPLSHTVRKYFPEFLLLDQSGNWMLIEIKADAIIDYRVLAAKSYMQLKCTLKIRCDLRWLR
ncbi:hypothetical protein L0Z72_04415 [candidate division KSB1 bacterium]|nr:hypothetical protein [candidate division KSB1 bacterium]